MINVASGHNLQNTSFASRPAHSQPENLQSIVDSVFKEYIRELLIYDVWREKKSCFASCFHFGHCLPVYHRQANAVGSGALYTPPRICLRSAGSLSVPPVPVACMGGLRRHSKRVQASIVLRFWTRCNTSTADNLSLWMFICVGYVQD